VQDRRCRIADDERRDNRSAGFLPPAATLAAVLDVERVVDDPMLAKELLGRGAGCSGPLPEERREFHCEIIAPT